MSGSRRRSRSKTVATWLAILGGGLGLHRFYLHGATDRWGWLLWLPTSAGAYGVQRMRSFGQDDQLAWVLIPLLGLALSASMLSAIVYGLMPEEQWRSRFDHDAASFSSPWLNVLGAVAGLSLGATALIASIAFSAQRYFEYQVQPNPTAAAGAQSNRTKLTP